MVKQVSRTGTSIYETRDYNLAVVEAKRMQRERMIPIYIWSGLNRNKGFFYVTPGDQPRPTVVKQVSILSTNGQLYERPE